MNESLCQSAQAAFSALDGILVINMDSSPERYEYFRSTVGKYLPADKVKRISAVAGRKLASYGVAPWFTEHTGERAPFWGGTGGCTLSHRNAIAYAKAQGWRHVLIFEDDVFFDAAQEAFELLAEAVRTLKGAYLLYLGYNKPAPFGRKVLSRGASDLWQTDGVIAAHAYVVSAELYDPLLAILPQHDDEVWEWLSTYRAIDVLYRDFVPYMSGVRVYVLDPIICMQRDGESDIGLNAAQGTSQACLEPPRSLCSAAGLWHCLTYPFRRLKIKLNSCRTRRRARRGGLPGYKKRRKKS